MGSGVKMAMFFSVGEFQHWGVLGKGGLYLIVMGSIAFNGIASISTCSAQSAPSVSDFVRDLEKLRGFSEDVEGRIEVFRAESVIPNAMEDTPSDLGIPLILEGELWRSKNRFRANFRVINEDSKAAKESTHSVALDDGVAYEFSIGVDAANGILRVTAADAPASITTKNFIEHKFTQAVNATWSTGGTPFANFLQRPGTRIVPNSSDLLPGGHAILVDDGSGNVTQFEFESSQWHPFGYCVTTAGQGANALKVERRVFSSDVGGKVLPTKVVQVVTRSDGGGYTEITRLSLGQLETPSPISRQITPSSFRDMGVEYQTYKADDTQKEELAERFEAPVAVSAKSVSRWRSLLLWLNGTVIVALLAYIVYRYKRK